MASRILIVCEDFVPRSGGVAMMMHSIANEIALTGVDTVVYPSKDVPPSIVRHYRFSNEVSGLKGQVSEGPKEPQVAKVVSQLRPDVILFGDFGYRPYLSNLFLDEKASQSLPEIQCLSICHGGDLLTSLPSSWPPLRRVAKWVRYQLQGKRSRVARIRRTLEDSTHVFANSAYTSSLIKSRFSTESTVIGCGIGLDVLEREVDACPIPSSEAKRGFKKQAGIPNRPTLISVGRLVASKNLAHTLQALRSLPDSQYVIVGSGPLEQELKDQASTLGVADRTIFVGQVSEEEKWTLLRSADVMSFPSIQAKGGRVEGFGIVMLEATAAGTPVVAGDTGGIRDFVKHEVTGLLVDPGKPSDSATAVQRLIDDENLKHRLVESGRKAIAERYNWGSIAQQILAPLQPRPTSV